ncbi:pyridoxamine 5'-phosphate oxidase family protein [Labedaea rhizosphaerae]|uniref:PPOX class probable F420-dependent enzyme n=1 Tax=Labedaea rhizosphaerae TaxID=598644 RepID=A0A4R6SP36_LABRH|nr:pyridoxamine 5'-phosphate oxidase family protein [Labedaea rhizosphaerae]TDQ05350.1 PPOX class probable F420-dependent enzyme [Labedaea rhizosphaerae]
MSRRAQIVMTPGEARAFLAQSRTANVATIGPNGRPHLVAVWFVPRGDGIATWTYRSSQKVRNLERLAQATVLVESGDTYDQLRGVSMECDVAIIEDVDEITAIGVELLTKHAGAADPGFVKAQAAKRVGLVFTPTRVVSWDHRKLGGTY